LPGPQAVDELVDSDVQSTFDVCATTCSDNGKIAAQAEKRMVVSRIVRLCLRNFVSPSRPLSAGDYFHLFMAIVIPDVSPDNHLALLAYRCGSKGLATCQSMV
jgi:hypothetical protein